MCQAVLFSSNNGTRITFTEPSPKELVDQIHKELEKRELSLHLAEIFFMEKSSYSNRNGMIKYIQPFSQKKRNGFLSLLLLPGPTPVS